MCTRKRIDKINERKAPAVVLGLQDNPLTKKKNTSGSHPPLARAAWRADWVTPSYPLDKKHGPKNTHKCLSRRLFWGLPKMPSRKNFFCWEAHYPRWKICQVLQPPWIVCRPKEKEQICRTRAEPQQIVATRLLYCLQYPVLIQVVCKGFTPAHIFSKICEQTPQVFPPRVPAPTYDGTRA